MYKNIITLSLSIFLFACDTKVSGTLNDKMHYNATPVVVDNRTPLPDVPLTDKIEQISAFVELANQVRYFHPSDAAQSTEWDRFVSYGIYKVASTSNQEEFVSTLRSLFATIAPNLKINGEATVPSDALSDSDIVMAWLQDGYIEANEQLDTIYTRERSQNTLSSFKAEYYSDTYFVESLAANIDIELPVLLKVENGHTLPTSQTLAEVEDYKIDLSFNSTYGRLTAASQMWSVIQHFYPYSDELDTTWSDELSPLLVSCIESAELCGKAMNKLLTISGDNNNWLAGSFTSDRYFTIPLVISWIEDKAVVLHKVDDSLGVELGDQLVAVDGVNIETLMQDKEQYSLRTPHVRNDRLVDREVLNGDADTEVTITLKNSAGSEYQLDLLRSAFASELRESALEMMTFKPEEKHRELGDGIHYVNLSAIESNDVTATMELLSNAQAIVLDLRNYPLIEGWQDVLAHFIEQPTYSLPMNTNQYSYPNQENAVALSVTHHLMPMTPYIDVPVVVLSSRFGANQNEYALGYVQDAGIPIIGEVTYGINGEAARVNLLGGYNNGAIFTFTGLKTTQHDGSPLRGVGIQPDIEVPLTIESVLQGKDVQLEAAIEYLKNQM